MTNDITTLNGSLRELGELMADNLTTQGVASTYDEGLTTLANKVLDIQGGGGSGSSPYLLIISDKEVIDYSTNEIATITAYLFGGDVENKTIEFYANGTSIGTSTTNTNGVATKSYSSQGDGSISLSATYDTVSSETITIYDSPQIHYTNDGTVVDLEYQSGVSVTSVDGEIVITTSSSGEKKVNFPTEYFASSRNVCCEMEYCGGGGSQIFAISINNSSNTSQGFVAVDSSKGMYIAIASSGTNSIYPRLEIGDKVKFVRENGYTKIYINDYQIDSRSRSVSSIRFGFYTNQNRLQKWKNIIIYDL